MEHGSAHYRTFLIGSLAVIHSNRSQWLPLLSWPMRRKRLLCTSLDWDGVSFRGAWALLHTKFFFFFTCMHRMHEDKNPWAFTTNLSTPPLWLLFILLSFRTLSRSPIVSFYTFYLSPDKGKLLGLQSMLVFLNLSLLQLNSTTTISPTPSPWLDHREATPEWWGHHC